MYEAPRKRTKRALRAKREENARREAEIKIFQKKKFGKSLISPLLHKRNMQCSSEAREKFTPEIPANFLKN